MNEPKRRRAVFLDRDGVINEKAPEGEYIMSPESLRIIDGAAIAIRRLNEAGLVVVVVTNQRGVARGLMTREDLDAVHAALREELGKSGAKLDLVLSCTHELSERCDCRKPRPGLLLQAACKLGLDLRRSWMIGDRESDVQAGRAAGCRTIRVCSGDEVPDETTAADVVLPALPGAVDLVLAEVAHVGIR